MTRQDHIIQVTRKARAICSCQCFCRRNVTEDPVRLVGGIDLCLMFMYIGQLQEEAEKRKYKLIDDR